MCLHCIFAAPQISPLETQRRPPSDMRAVKFRELVAKNRLFREAAPATSCGQLSTHTRNTLRGPRGLVPFEMRERERERERERKPGALGLRTVSCGQDLLSHAMHGPLTCVIKYRDRKYHSQPITILHARSHDHVAREMERERNCLYRTLA